MSDTSHRTTSESQAVKRAKARKASADSKRADLTYFIMHRWLPKSARRPK